jgi:chemotaxis protein MotC
MTPEQARTVYLRLARRAAIDGDAELLAFASRHARVDDAASVDDVRDARSTLYASISSVTSDSVAEVLARLGELDASQLSASDRALLEAARAVASEVIAPVTPRPAKSRPAPPPDREASALPPPDRKAPAPVEAAADPLVVAARARLEEIDRLLEEGKP